jgi:hypothetical protein
LEVDLAGRVLEVDFDGRVLEVDLAGRVLVEERFGRVLLPGSVLVAALIATTKLKNKQTK